jgi:hypothetical protein
MKRSFPFQEEGEEEQPRKSARVDLTEITSAVIVLDDEEEAIKAQRARMRLEFRVKLALKRPRPPLPLLDVTPFLNRIEENEGEKSPVFDGPRLAPPTLWPTGSLTSYETKLVAPKPLIHAYDELKRRSEPLRVDIEELQKTRPAVDNIANAHPLDARVVLDERIVDGKKLHDYYIDGIKQPPGRSVTAAIKKFFKPFDALRVAGYCAKSKKPKYAGKTVEEILAMWAQTGTDGTAKHKGMEAYLQHLPLPEDALQPAPGFFKMLAEHPEIAPKRTEWMIVDEVTKMTGSIDWIDGLTLGDWKNYNAGTMLEQHDGAMGTHPLSKHQPDTKLMHATYQLNFYRTILERNGYLGDQKIKAMKLFNFPPDDPDTYEEYDIPFLDMSEHMDLFPWNSDDLRHQMPDSPDLPPMLLPRIPAGDPRGQGLTTNARVQQGPLPPNSIWVGRKYQKGAYDLQDSKWKNRHGRFGVPDAETAVPFEKDLLRDKEKLEALVPELYGKTLLCWCDGIKNTSCHGDVLARYANALASGAIALKNGQKDEQDEEKEAESSSDQIE